MAGSGRRAAPRPAGPRLETCAAVSTRWPLAAQTGRRNRGRSHRPPAGGHMQSRIDAAERIEVSPGLSLRVLRRQPDGTSAAGTPTDGRTASAPNGAGRADFVLVHGLASNARLWDGVARHLAEEGYGSVAVDL